MKLLSPNLNNKENPSRKKNLIFQEMELSCKKKLLPKLLAPKNLNKTFDTHS